MYKIMNTLSQNRKKIIAEVLEDLELLKNNPLLNQYAVNENIAFFEATKSILSSRNADSDIRFFSTQEGLE